MRKLFQTVLFVGASILWVQSASAAPVISSFTVSPSFVNFGHTVTFSWTISGGGYGQSIYFSCESGVTIKTVGGSPFTCGAYQSIGVNEGVGSASFYMTNVSGMTQNVRVKFAIKDEYSVLNEAGAREITVPVATSPQPILSFTAASTTIISGTPFNLSWTGNDLAAANIQFECAYGIKVYSLQPSLISPLPCGMPAYNPDLAGTGVVNVNVVNESDQISYLTARVFPALGSGYYDATHAHTLALTVTGKSAPNFPTITKLSAKADKVSSGSDISLSWEAQNVSGVNFQIQCVADVVINAAEPSATSTSARPCNTVAFNTAYPSAGTLSLTAVNSGYTPRPFIITALPQGNDGTYDGTRSKSVVITVLNPGASMPVPPTQTTVAPQTTPRPQIKIVRELTFSVPLTLGSRNKEVSALQRFLAQDATLYPEGIVSGYFGSLTELAVKRFQERYGLAKKGDPGYGFVGPKTRLKLNTLENF